MKPDGKGSITQIVTQRANPVPDGSSTPCYVSHTDGQTVTFNKLLEVMDYSAFSHAPTHTHAFGSSFAQSYLLCVCVCVCVRACVRACVFYTVLKTAPFFSPSEQSIGPVGVHSCDVRTSSSAPDNTGDNMSPNTSQTPARLLFLCLCNTGSRLS